MCAAPWRWEQAIKGKGGNRLAFAPTSAMTDDLVREARGEMEAVRGQARRANEENVEEADA